MRLVQRPYDNPIPFKIRVETEAILNRYYSLSGTEQRQQRAPLLISRLIHGGSSPRTCHPITGQRRSPELS